MSTPTKQALNAADALDREHLLLVMRHGNLKDAAEIIDRSTNLPGLLKAAQDVCRAFDWGAGFADERRDLLLALEAALKSAQG